jgi:hypothetical protein
VIPDGAVILISNTPVGSVFSVSVVASKSSVKRSASLSAV